MTINRAFAIVILSTIGFGVAGTAIGCLLAVVAPDYYRGVFGARNSPDFNPVAMGFGLGLTQGVFAGLFVGSVVVLAVAWFWSRVGTPSRHSDL
jgi:hypothetical protein